MRRVVIFAALGWFVAASSFAGEPDVLRVASPAKPAHFAPLGPLTDADRQAFDLIFEPLIGVSNDGRPHPALAASLPSPDDVTLPMSLRPGAKWSTGEPVSASDVRHTFRLARSSPHPTFAWAGYLDAVQLGGTPGDVRVPLKHGLLNPWPLLTLPIVPQLSKGRELPSLDDAEFAKNPIGSGPFAFAGPVKAGKADGIAFRVNPHHPSADRLPFKEVHWFAATDAKTLDAIKPHLTLGSSAQDRPGAKSVVTRRVEYVAINHRRPALAQPDLRRFLGLSIERDKIGGDSVNGLTPRDSWTLAAPPRVPGDLFQPEIARGLAKKIATGTKSIALTFTVPADRSKVAAALIDRWTSAATAAGLDLKISLKPLDPAEFATALVAADFDLALAGEDFGDVPARFGPLFAWLGVQDAELASLIAALPRSRQFPILRQSMQNLHVHLVQTMPIIPLWRHHADFALDGWRVELFDPLRPFADPSAWRKMP